MTDNFEIVKRILDFKSDDDFYFVQILQRKKDNPGGIFGSNNSSRLIKAYYIKSIDQLDKLKDEMIHFATYFNARVGINLNKRSFYKTAFNTLRNISEQLHNKEFKQIHRAYNTACGVHNGGDKFYILDIDGTIPYTTLMEMEDLINKSQPEGKTQYVTYRQNQDYI